MNSKPKAIAKIKVLTLLKVRELFSKDDELNKYYTNDVKREQ